MEWKELCDLILNSIQIVGIFIAIIIGLVISKVMDLKKEKSETEETLEDINNELSIMKEQFNKLKKDNYDFYKEENVYDIIENLFNDEEFIATNTNPYVTEKEEKEFYLYVKEYLKKVVEFINNDVSIEDCKKKLKIKKDSVEETIVEELYERWDFDEFN